MIDDSIRFSLARVSFGARTTTAPRERGSAREREREKDHCISLSLFPERKKERPVEYYTPGAPLFWKEKSYYERRKESFPTKTKKKQKNSRDEFRVFVLALWDRDLFFLGFFQTVFCLPKSLSKIQKKKNGRQKRPPKHQRLLTFLRYPIGRRRRRSSVVVALSVSFSLSFL